MKYIVVCDPCAVGSMCVNLMYMLYHVRLCHHAMTTRYMKATASPSWSEVWNFVKFLSFQLEDCEQSYYTNPEYMDDDSLPGFKEFIVKFMILMSKVIRFHSDDVPH